MKSKSGEGNEAKLFTGYISFEVESKVIVFLCSVHRVFFLPLGSLVLNLHVGVEGSLGDNLEVKLIGAIVRVRVSLDSLSELLEDLLDLGRLLQVLLVRSLEELDVLRLESLGLEHRGEVEGIDDLVDLSFFCLWLQDRVLCLVHHIVF